MKYFKCVGMNDDGSISDFKHEVIDPTRDEAWCVVETFEQAKNYLETMIMDELECLEHNKQYNHDLTPAYNTIIEIESEPSKKEGYNGWSSFTHWAGKFTIKRVWKIWNIFSEDLKQYYHNGNVMRS